MYPPLVGAGGDGRRIRRDAEEQATMRVMIWCDMEAICGDFDCPCVFISGDTATCREVRALLGEQVVEAQVKEALGRYSARHLPASDACALIEGRVYAALASRNWPKPLKFPPPVT